MCAENSQKKNYCAHPAHEGNDWEDARQDFSGCNQIGKLSIVTTPIGNLEDMTFRAVRVLEEADTVLCEDTRRTIILLNHFQLKKKVESYHIFNEHAKTAGLIERVKRGGKLALVSDAGTPCIADPGFLLIREAANAGIMPEIIPGVSALTFSICASGLPSDRVTFYGFIPVKSGKRASILQEIAKSNHTAVIFESPFRIEKLISEIMEYISPDVRIAIVREATKLHEEVIRGTASEIAEQNKDRVWKGEFVCVIDAKSIDIQ